MKISARTLMVFLLVTLLYAAPGLGAAAPGFLDKGLSHPAEGQAVWMGARLAWLRHNRWFGPDAELVILDTATGLRTVAASPGAYYVGATREAFYVLSRRPKDAPVAVITGHDPADARVVSRDALGFAPAMLSSHLDGRRILLYAYGVRPNRLGSLAEYALYVHEPGASPPREVWSGRQLQMAPPGHPAYEGKGWMGASPTDTVAALVEFVRPPAAEHYARVILVDYVEGRVAGEFKTRQTSLSRLGGWGPDGLRMLLPFTTGGGALLLDVREMGRIGTSDLTGRGRFGPQVAWNPGGDLFYSGGAILNGLIEPREAVSHAAGPLAHGIWAPGGGQLAIITARGELLLLEGPDPGAGGSAMPSDIGGRIWMLRELGLEGLITYDDYTSRRLGLLLPPPGPGDGGL